MIEIHWSRLKQGKDRCYPCQEMKSRVGNIETEAFHLEDSRTVINIIIRLLSNWWILLVCLSVKLFFNLVQDMGERVIL